MMASKPKPVKGWMCDSTGVIGHVKKCEECYPVHIAPTATHAVVELAKVAVMLNEVAGANDYFSNGMLAALAYLGLTQPAKCNRKKGRGK